MQLDVSLFHLLKLHHKMVSDEIRTKLFRKAIFQTVKKGDVVVDIGTGTGILAFFAIQAGAEKVYAIDSSSIIEVAKNIARDNDLLDKIIFLESDSSRITLPEKADVLISETVGSFGLEENICNTILHGKNNFLKPNGRIIPEEIELYLSPVNCKNMLDEVKWMFLQEYSINNHTLENLAIQNAYKINLQKSELLSEPQLIGKINFNENHSISHTLKGCFRLKDCEINGFGGWFKLKLSRDIYLDASPFSPLTHWMQSFFPLYEKKCISNDELITIEIKNHPLGNSCFWEWNTEIGEEKYHHSTFNCLPSIDKLLDMYNIV